MCSICSPLKSSCLEYDSSNTSLLVHAWDFNSRVKATLDFNDLKNFGGALDFLSNLFFQDMMIVKDQGSGNIKVGGS